MRRAASAGTGTLSSSRPCLMKTTRRSVTWHPEQMNVWCSQPRKCAVSSGTTLVRINSEPHAVKRIGRTLTNTRPFSARMVSGRVQTKAYQRYRGAGTPVVSPRRTGPLLIGARLEILQGHFEKAE
jgi:hypothetical protein